MTVADDIDKLAEFLETHGWCQNVSATDAAGNVVSIYHPDARSWCVVGASQVVLRVERVPPVLLVISAFIANSTNDVIPRTNVPAWNDKPGRTKEEVIVMLRRAANAQRERSR